MAFLTLNGITVQVADGSFKKDVDVVGGGRERALSGALRSTFIANKRKWSGATAPLPPAEAEAWRRLLLGECDAVGWDANLYSGRGLPPAVSTGAARSSTAPVKFGLYLSVGTTPVVYNFALGAVWSYSVWRNNAGAWQHYIVRSDGAKWFAGGRNDATVAPLAVDGTGNVTLPASQKYDELVVFPFLVPDAWAVPLFTATAPFTYPELAAAGTSIDGAPRSVLPAYGGAAVQRVAGGYVESISFDLEEV